MNNSWAVPTTQLSVKNKKINKGQGHYSEQFYVSVILY